MAVLANAETMQDISTAMSLGADGVGLVVRTEHCFFEGDRLNVFRAVIVSVTPEERAQHLRQLELIQTKDFTNIYRLACDGTVGPGAKISTPISKSLRTAEKAMISNKAHQCTIRLLDPPLDEFLPNSRDKDFEKEVERLAIAWGLPLGECMNRVSQLQESNDPLMGFRGVCIGVVHSDITRMQVKSILSAGLNVLQV